MLIFRKIKHYLKGKQRKLNDGDWISLFSRFHNECNRAWLADLIVFESKGAFKTSKHLLKYMTERILDKRIEGEFGKFLLQCKEENILDFYADIDFDAWDNEIKQTIETKKTIQTPNTNRQIDV